MDLTTVAKKIDMGQYESVGDFKSDFILMCNNAMTYNAPETVYYASAKRLLTTGLQIIAKVSVRVGVATFTKQLLGGVNDPLPVFRRRPLYGQTFVMAQLPSFRAAP